MLRSRLTRARRRRPIRDALSAALVALMTAAACGGDEGAGPPRVQCPPNFCAQAPVCGQKCGSPCGCCDCAPGSSIEYAGITHVCTGSCFAPGYQVDGGGGSAGSAGSAGSGQDAAADACTGCVSPLLCGQTCADPCGCCPCTDGEQQDIGGQLHGCIGGCFTPI